MPQRPSGVPGGTYFDVLSDFGLSWLAGEELLSPLELEGEDAPLPAEPFVPLELGVELELADDAPPPAWSFFSASVELDEDELDGLLLDGLDGVLVAPDEEEPDGELDGVVVVLDEEPVAARSLPARSHAVSRLAPSAMETAIARVDNLMWPPWLGY